MGGGGPGHAVGWDFVGKFLSFLTTAGARPTFCGPGGDFVLYPDGEDFPPSLISRLVVRFCTAGVHTHDILIKETACWASCSEIF